ncbi:MAG: ABC transporter permease [Victivallaceae bacterium]
MLNYFLKRILLLPVTLCVIILVNFIILNFAPGDSCEDKGGDFFGEAGKSDRMKIYKGPDRHLLFREHYGLTLPILFNNYPAISHAQVKKAISDLKKSKDNPAATKVSFSELRVRWGDRARYIMPILLFEASNASASLAYRSIAADLFIRGGLKSGITGFNLTPEQICYNREVSEDGALLLKLLSREGEDLESFEKRYQALREWFDKKGGYNAFVFKGVKKYKIFFFETRLCRYLSKIVRLDFGSLRSDTNKPVIDEVTKRIKYSLLLSVLPMCFVFVLCQIFGMIMAVYRNKWPDHILNILFLILFSVPVFVAVPWMIENFAINKTIPFTNIPVPYADLYSSKEIFDQLSSFGRLIDIVTHCVFPFIAVSYGAFASQSRFSRSIFLNLLKQDYVRTAVAKGLPKLDILVKHVGRNAAIPLVTSLASSLGAILGGALVVETLFEINGFGRFFYQAVLDRDHNVILFSVLAGSCLSLLGYLLGDLSYALLDPRIRPDQRY